MRGFQVSALSINGCRSLTSFSILVLSSFLSRSPFKITQNFFEVQKWRSYSKMGDPNGDGRNQEFAPMEKGNIKLSWVWCHGLNSIWNTTDIVVSALQLALPPLVVLSVLEFVLSAPFGFMFSVCPAIYDIVSILLREPGPERTVCSGYEDLSGDDLGKEDEKCYEEKVKEEGYEQDYDPEEEEKESKDETRRVADTRIETGEIHRSEIQEEGIEDGVADKFEENEYQKVKQYRKESNDGAEKDIDIEVVKEKESTTTTRVEADSVEREELSKEKRREIRADKNKQDGGKSVTPSTRMTSPFLSWESQGSFGNLEELLEQPEDETADGFRQDCDEVDAQFPQIEPGEFVKETMEIAEAVRNESEAETENFQQSMEEAMSILPSASGSLNRAALDLERVKLLALEDSVVDVPRLQTFDEQMESGKVKKKDGELASLQVEFQHTTNTSMEVDPKRMEQVNPVGDIWSSTYRSTGYEKKFE